MVFSLTPVTSCEAMHPPHGVKRKKTGKNILRDTDTTLKFTRAWTLPMATHTYQDTVPGSATNKVNYEYPSG